MALAIPPLRRLHEARNTLLRDREQLSRQLAACEHRLAERSGGSPFYHYNATFDPIEVIRRHAVAGLAPTPGYSTNFLGVLVDPKFLPDLLQASQGQVEGVPIPANWHADIAEWGAALRAVDLARDRFTIIELGCGWGCWMNNAGMAARRAGLAVQLIGVEGDPGHVDYAFETCAANGFDASDVTVRRGVAAPAAGVALFPRRDQADAHWGLEPIFGASEQQRAGAVRSGSHDEVRMIELAELTAGHDRIDLLHVDVQGGEADLLAGSLPTLDAKVAYIVVGTHSRQIEGRIMETLLAAGWLLEIERPAILAIDAFGPRVTVDGVQGWRNPTLCPWDVA